jgi:hypothetical protein
MKKHIGGIVFIIAVVAFIVLSMTGCGHNVLAFSSGKFLNLGVDPNTGKMGVQYVDGEQVTVVEKDNAVLTVEMKDGLDATGKKTTKVSKITYEIKEQVTGSDVELATMKEK